jgi:hypothetical protein
MATPAAHSDKRVCVGEADFAHAKRTATIAHSLEWAGAPCA